MRNTKFYFLCSIASTLVITLLLFSQYGKTMAIRQPQLKMAQSETSNSDSTKSQADAKSNNATLTAPSPVDPTAIQRHDLAERLGPQFRLNQYPSTVQLQHPVHSQPEAMRIKYSFDKKAQSQIEKMIRQYGPDHAAFVAMDARTGKILSMFSYERGARVEENLALQARFPAASIFKLVTASAAVDENKASPETIVSFTGANHTLYKKNVKETAEGRWARHMTVREAFARSVNSVFGKLGLFIVGPDSLNEYASRYKFNQSIDTDVPFELGATRFHAGDSWSVVEAASGYTRENTLSPLHGAMMAAAVANDGVMMEPYLVENLTDQSGASLYSVTPKTASIIMSPTSAESVRELMHETVRAGTSRKWFKKALRKSKLDLEDVEFGGKTGSLTGLHPKGKCDWFIGYARYGEIRIAVSALTVNEKKWRVKSSTLASTYLKEYLRNLQMEEDLVATRQPSSVAK